MEFLDLALLLVIAGLTILATSVDTNRAIKHLASELSGDFDKIVQATCDAMAKDGKETRATLTQLGELMANNSKSTLEIITKSHLATKVELKELLELHER